jgi:hypothetical protein
VTHDSKSVAAATGSPDILAALRQASIKTGSDFDYLLATAMRKSSLKPDAKSAHSSATGWRRQKRRRQFLPCGRTRRFQ